MDGIRRYLCDDHKQKQKKSTCEYTVRVMTGGILEYEVILDFIIEFHRGECFVQGRRRLKHY